MKLLVFAHVPPPHHGQSAMVQLMLDGLRSGNYGEFEIHHVDARFSDSMEEIGGHGLGKLFRAIRFSLQAIRYRFRHQVKTFYYVPAPPKPSAMLRDWIVLALCRPFFPQVIFHWHAVGLGTWTAEAGKSGGLANKLAATLNRLLHGRHQRSLVLTDWGRGDVAVFSPREIALVGNGIPDPCADFDTTLLTRRQERRGRLTEALTAQGPRDTYTACFLGHCTTEKGLWDAMKAVALAAAELRQGDAPLGIKLRVAGEFPAPEDSRRFAALQQSLTTEFELPEDWIEHVGFVGGKAKRAFLEAADCLCFPTKYSAESFGLVAAEALAFGIPAVTSDWRMLPELMTGVGLPVARTGDPESLAEHLLASIGRDDPAELRAAFTKKFTAHAHLEQLSKALVGS